ncbi:MAG: DUF1367 family protein [Balneola sp.]
MKFQAYKTDKGTLLPCTEKDREKFGKLGISEVVTVKAVDARNAGFHRKFFAMINTAFDTKPEKFDRHFPDADALRKELLKRAGYYTSYIDFKGVTQYEAQSISFDSMGQEKFEEVYSRVLDVIIKWLFPEVPKEVFESEIMSFA